MNLYSTNNPEATVDFETAVFQSLPPDNGLYMPAMIPRLAPATLAALPSWSFEAIAFEAARVLLDGAIGDSALKNIISETVSFPAPVVQMTPDAYVLELFHGPSMAFKDFGARFMSRVMGYFLQRRKNALDILVATSGDTGGAVAMGFYKVPNIRVTILYPSGKVSPIQEKQLTTLGGNIRALEINGTFDDCQRLVKQAFLDRDLNTRMNLSSANSINISRLIPQTFYYFNAYAQLRREGDDRPVVFSVPSGNFGNLTAGLIAARMGLPVERFIAATNMNDEVPRYLSSGRFEPRPSLQTISNAMDVGNPSNFSRMLDLFDHDVALMGETVNGYAFTDERTREAIEEVFDTSGYIMCPHTSIAYLGLMQFLKEHGGGPYAPVLLSTAHPCKFEEVYGLKLRARLDYPPQVSSFGKSEKNAERMDPVFDTFKKRLLHAG